MGQLSLNLTRKWRSKKFKEIVGQDLVVKILQNSLYKNTFFPVYLFSGQRGCGKTTTARVFAAAMNCSNLPEFQKNPKKQQIPCGTCDSCKAMMTMRHPDFVEIDAASYTGVDNIRNIIDTSSFLPILSQRKVYLVDEVHMLSKAAFNAFLKILEEPPPFVVFILATTEMQKLPDTVKSRCFQLIFNPVQTDVVINHLKTICNNESIDFEESALELIAQSTEGSLRDAINLLEQSRFASDKVSKAAVSAVLGYLDDTIVYDIASALLQRDYKALLTALQVIGKSVISADYLLKSLQELLYDAIMLKHNVAQRYYLQIPDAVKKIITETEVHHIIYCFEQLSLCDELLSKTSKKQLMLESRLIAIVMLEHSAMSVEKKKSNKVASSDNDKHQWITFLESVAKDLDPILYSMLYESDFVLFDSAKNSVHILALKKFSMFQDLFIEHKKMYQPFLERYFGSDAILYVEFGKVAKEKKLVEHDQPKKVPTAQVTKHVKSVLGKLDISDKKKWEVTHTLLKHFGGTVLEMGKDTHESDA